VQIERLRLRGEGTSKKDKRKRKKVRGTAIARAKSKILREYFYVDSGGMEGDDMDVRERTI